MPKSEFLEKVQKKLSEITTAEIRNDKLFITNADYDIYHDVEFSSEGMLVSVNAFGQSDSRLITWDELDGIKKDLSSS